ncbi:MAG: 4'-phosphopantetheinyl transferase superfamily protein [Magnetococcales bacterium]|nr:4'-phosphopantetheinyl transferase superfamily protein [Magnetococcales bacterium]
MIRILLAEIHPTPLSPPQWQALLNQVPENHHPAILRFRRWQDRQATLLGRLLLRHALLEAKHEAHTLRDWRLGEHGKPRVAEDIFFNISHTEGLVICAVSRLGEVGIDCERIRPIPLEDFQNLMDPAIWQTIHTAPNPQQAFFDFWTARESVVKGDGRGLSIPFSALEIQDNRATIRPPHAPAPHGIQNWHIHPVTTRPGYCCHLATPVPTPPEAPILWFPDPSLGE